MAKSTFGHIEKHRNTGKWRVFWTENSKLRSKVVPTYTDATRLLARLRLQCGHVDSSISLVHYYNNVIEPTFSRLAKRTAFDYRYTWEKIRPIIGDCKISEITKYDIQKTIDKFTSPKMQQKVFVLLRKILNSALDDDIIIKNPCNKNIRRLKIKPKKKRLYDKEELKDVLMKVKDTEWALPVLLECVCGLRHEEFCGLNKRDLVFDNNCAYVEVKQALTEVNGKKILKEPKTDTSVRTVVLTEDFLDYLTEQWPRITNKKTLDEYDYPLKLTKRWRRYCKNNELPYVTFGNMRSVYATLCSEAGCLDSVVCKTMGHTGKTIKERNYQSSTLKALKFNAEILSEYINFKYDSPDVISLKNI